MLVPELKRGIRTLSKTEVSQDTYELLLLLNIEPQFATASDTIRKYKECFSWITDKDEEETNLLAFSGEADPRIWNAVEDEMMTALEKGMTYIFCGDEGK
jgi:hypothetical protein